MLHIKWIPRALLTDVDALSRKIDFDDWETTEHLFQFLNKKWGPFTRDCFADSKNTKLSKIFSKYMCPNTAGVNAFLYSCAGGKNYLVPPVYLVGKTIKHLQFFKASGVLVVPYWFSATFWVYLCRNQNQFQSFVKDYIVFDNPKNCVKQGLKKRLFHRFTFIS